MQHRGPFLPADIVRHCLRGTVFHDCEYPEHVSIGGIAIAKGSHFGPTAFIEVTMIIGLEAAREFNLRSGPQPEFAGWLERNGVNLSHALNIVGPIVEHDIVIFPGMLFDLAEPCSPDAIRAVVQVALDENAETPIDLVAWTRERPHTVFRCLGSAPVIGLDQLFNSASYFANQPLLVHRSPLSWLASGCVGIVPLDYDALRERLNWLHGECRLAAESLAHGRTLRDALAPLPDNVRIVVPRSEAA
jgi:hypothetical protein